MKLRTQQIEILSKIANFFKIKQKGLLSGACSSGKTIIALYFIKDFLIKNKKRVAISTFSKREIRDQWIRAIIKSKIISLKDVQIVCSKNDVKKLRAKGLPAVSNGDVSKTVLVTIFIPQSIPNTNALGKFDYIIIDEAHDYLDICSSGKGILKNIIKKISIPQTKILGLTGTGHELMKKGAFFEKNEKTFHVVYDMPTALKDNVINNCNIIAEYFKFDIKKELYNSQNLNKKGEAFVRNKLLKNKSTHSLKLEKILKNVKGKTLLISLPKYAKALSNFINLLMGENASIYKICSLSDKEQEINEQEFKNNPNTNFMVVINMCNIGWNYPELQNVIDLTFTKSPKLIIQRLSRAIRLSENGIKKDISNYIYCADQSKSELMVRWYLSQALELTTEKGIFSYDGMVYIPIKKMIKKGETEEKTIKIGSISDYYNYDVIFKSLQNKTIMRRSLAELNTDNRWHVFIQLIFKLEQEETAKHILQKCIKLRTNFAGNKEEAVILKCLNLVKKEQPNLWNKIYKNETPENLIYMY